MTPETINHIHFALGLVLGLVFGFITGYIIALRSKRPENEITAVQLLSVLTLFGYLLVSFTFGKDVSWIIASAILATGYGAKGGAIIQHLLEGKGKK